MNTIKKCPACNSTRITGAISVMNGRYMQGIKCKKCGYTNKRDIGDAERKI